MRKTSKKNVTGFFVPFKVLVAGGGMDPAAGDEAEI